MHPHQPRPAAPRQHPFLIAAALAVILFCAVGTAAIMGWLPASKGSSRNQLSDTDRAALTAGLQQETQPAYAPPPPLAAPQAMPLQPAVTATGVPVQALAAAPAAPSYPGASVQYGASGSQGATASGAAPAYPAAPAEPVREVAPVRTTEADTGTRWCGTCGNVESVRTITTRARASGVGAAGGAILGGLLGNQVGGGHGRQLATVAGAVGGAVVGNQVEGNMKATQSFEIRVRLDDGTLRTFHQQSAPRWRNGDRVRIVKGSLRAA
ncbi:glycine zipper 2TM domain-containing protein [Herbaspirillum sp. SJZ107]|uniref:glycine zipper 2TM domain-containing protein n=1 Tax=Herbaspirillum sp. SJZ107 TaxID=2572881 RepID=UPI0011720E1B|nr:glycine zipper 2TM domain-containing protein [Herbaspirillum sp. SJZ107]TQK10736.1 glycine zipper 2TM protein [Herbaspirillum sp. SJZ107]